MFFIYSVKTSESNLTVSQLIHWLNEYQRDPQLNEILFPMFDKKAVQSIIDKYETRKDIAKKGTVNLIHNIILFNFVWKGHSIVNFITKK